MECYKSVCPECKHVRYWQGYKTLLGQDASTIAWQQQNETVCANCGYQGVETTLDRETFEGQRIGALYGFAAKVIQQELGLRPPKTT